MISDYGTDCVGKCEGFREEQPENGVDYARKIYRDNRDSVAVYAGDGSRRSSICFRRVLTVDRDGVVRSLQPAEGAAGVGRG